MNLKIKDKTLLLAFEIIGKKPRQRTEQEKLWIKPHGGSLGFEIFRNDINSRIRRNSYINRVSL